jgi:hypothetical protein
MGYVRKAIVQWETGVVELAIFVRAVACDGVELVSQTALSFYQTPALM